MALLLLAGCATTTIENAGTVLAQPLCRPGEAAVPVALYWQTQWRPDQKEPALRESIAQRGIGQFVAGAGCLAAQVVAKLPAASGHTDDGSLRERARRDAPGAARIVHVAVRELGPRLLIGTPGVVEGGTEVLLEVRVLDAPTGAVLAGGLTRWRHGGSFVVKGLWTLERDMEAALRAALLPGLPPA